MCEFLSALATRDGRLLFSEEDSHEELIIRAGFIDTSRHLRHWVRVEQQPSHVTLRVDETSTPGWFEADRALWQDRVTTLMSRLTPTWETYRATRAAALATCQGTCTPARATYEAICAAAAATRGLPRVAATATYRAAKATYRETCDRAWIAYETVRASAQAPYDATCASAQATYAAEIRTIDGYLSPRDEQERRSNV